MRLPFQPMLYAATVAGLVGCIEPTRTIIIVPLDKIEPASARIIIPPPSTQNLQI